MDCKIRNNDKKKDYYLKRRHGKITENVIKKLNKSNYINYKRKINDKHYNYEIENFKTQTNKLLYFLIF